MLKIWQQFDGETDIFHMHANEKYEAFSKLY